MRIRITENQEILLLNEAKIDDLLLKYNKDDEYLPEIRTLINNIDPTPTKKYLEWLFKEFTIKGLITFSSDIENYLKRFYELTEKNQIKNKDINSYKSYEDLIHAVLMGEEEYTKKTLKGQYRKIYEDEQYIMVRPLTVEASCRFGVDTRWCISAKHNNRFSQYTKEQGDEFYFVIKKGESRGKYSRLAIQLHRRGNITIWNSEDIVEDIKILKTLPNQINDIIKQKIKEKEELNLDCYEHFRDITSIKYPNTWGGFERIKFDPRDKIFAIYKQINPMDDGTYYTQIEKIANSENMIITFIFKYNNKKSKLYRAHINCTRDKFYTEMNIDGFVRIVNDKFLEIKRKINQIKGEFIIKGDITYWYPANSASSYSFENPKTAGPTTKAFIEYVKTQNERGLPATKKDFVESLGREYRSGYLSQFFGSIRDSGIVRIIKGDNYILGPNYEKYLQGKLRRK